MKKYLFALLCGLFGFSAVAETVSVSGGTVTYTGAIASTMPDGDVVLVYDNAAQGGTLSLSKNAKARLLLVGGGGAGGTMAANSTRAAAGGGGAGGMSDREAVIYAGDYTIQIGEGGRKVDSNNQSWSGAEGGITALKRGDEYIASAVGGGGGGSSKVAGNGTAGGCGGGGSWYYDFLSGGTGADGYGSAGGTPVDMNYGGGGGGASTNAVGHGGIDGTAGEGRYSDITGDNILYGQGGRGGDRTDSSYTASDGDGVGFGGDGAVNGFGGAGHAGILVVRIHNLFEYTKVPFPKYVTSFEFTNNTHYTSFDLARQDPLLQAAIKSVEGVTQVDTYISGGVTNGLGRHKFTVNLNDEYLWDIGEDGSSSPYICNWRILEKGTIGLASADITKNVEWSQGKDAKIAIDVHLTPEIQEHVQNVLVLGSLCYAHGLSEDVVTTTLDTLAKVANVDYYYYNKVQTASSSAVNNATGFSGHLDKGEEFSGNVPTDTNNHGTLYAFYEQLWRAMQSGTKYDYIVFSFDRTKVATTFPGAHEHEAEVAQYLKPFYDSNSVIWLVDNQPATGPNSNIPQYPWYPSQLVYIYYGNGGNSQWTSLYGYRQAASVTGENDYVSWKALMGMFDPTTYANTAIMSQNNYNNNLIQNNAGITKAKDDATRGSAIANQCVYDNADNVEDMIRNVVVAKSFTAVINDNVCVHMGLDVQEATATWTTNESIMGWVDMTSDQLQITDTGVQINLTNLANEAWIKLKIDVTDTGKFLSSQGATYNERTGKWEKDPNDGPVVVTLAPDDHHETILAEARASTSIAWSFKAFKVTASVVSGPKTGKVIINGFDTGTLSVGEGYSPEVVFNGGTGYVLNYLEVDGKVITDYEPGINSWLFQNIGADHDVKVGFEKVDMKLIKAVQRYPWNNLVDIDYFIGGNPDKNTGAMFARLVFFVEYLDDDGQPVKKQLMTFRDNDNMYFNWPFANQETIKIGADKYAKLRTYGYHRVTWDSNADGVAIFRKKSVKFSMFACQGEEH